MKSDQSLTAAHVGFHVWDTAAAVLLCACTAAVSEGNYLT